MNRPPKRRTEVAELLTAAKDAAGFHWHEVEADTGIRKATREGWFRSSTGQPPLGPVVYLAEYLGVPADALFAAALADYEAPIAPGASAAAKREARAALREAEAVALDAEAAVRRGREKAARKRRRSA